VEVRPGRARDVFIDVDGGHASRGPDEMSEQRGVVAGAGTDLEHPLSGPYVELLEHDGHDLGLGGRADDVAIGQALRCDPAVPVRLFDRHVGNEEVARHGRECFRDRGRPQGALRPQGLDEGSAQYGGVRHLSRGARHPFHRDRTSPRRARSQLPRVPHVSVDGRRAAVCAVKAPSVARPRPR
jgi:hypothetical protein